MSYSLIFVIVTVLVSLAAFNNDQLRGKLIFWPWRMNDNPSEYYRFITAGFIHADYEHLIFNMITLFFFGPSVEYIFEDIVNPLFYPIIYISAIAISSIPGYIKFKKNANYSALGASGAVSAIIFASIYYNPWSMINFIIPGFLFGIIYLVYSYNKARKNNDNIGHDAHFTGALYGLIIAYIIDPYHGKTFINLLLHPPFL